MNLSRKIPRTRSERGRPSESRYFTWEESRRQPPPLRLKSALTHSVSFRADIIRGWGPRRRRRTCGGVAVWANNIKPKELERQRRGEERSRTDRQRGEK